MSERLADFYEERAADYVRLANQAGPGTTSGEFYLDAAARDVHAANRELGFHRG